MVAPERQLRRRRPATLKDISAKLGVSVNTVSRALAGKDAVSGRTRALVQAEAERLGYVPNAIARSLVAGSATALGLVITNPSNPFYATLISAIEQRGRVLGYSLVLMASEESLDNERRAVESLLRWSVDGAIVVPVQQEVDHWRRLHTAGVPFVLVNRDLPELGCDFVGIDYEKSAYEATCHLHDGGARTVHLMEEDLSISPVDDRIAGFRRALADRKMEGRIIRVPTRRSRSSALPWDPEDAYHLARRLVADLTAGSAVMVGNDHFALGIYRALREAGMRIPAQVAVMGYGDHPFSPYLDPPLSSVRLPSAEIGSTAVDLLIRRLGDGDRDGPPEKIRLDASLVPRSSTGS